MEFGRSWDRLREGRGRSQQARQGPRSWRPGSRTLHGLDYDLEHRSCELAPPGKSSSLAHPRTLRIILSIEDRRRSGITCRRVLRDRELHVEIGL